MNPEHRPGRLPIGARGPVILAALISVTAAALSLMGQPWWCARGDLAPWSFDVNSPHNSQHLFDPYTLTHVLHGLALYGVMWWLARKRLAHGTRFSIAMVAEAAWEIIENTDFVIDRYRETTISLDYHGDSVLNSLADIVACAVGYGFALVAPVWASVALFAGIEVLLLAWIRDSLLLNILMLLWPLDAVYDWQTRG